MTNMDPRETSGPDGSGATQYQGPETIDSAETENFMPGQDFEFGSDHDGDGDVEIDENRWDSWEEYQEYQERMNELEDIDEAIAAEAAAQAAAEAAAREEADAARAEAHANGEPYHEGSGTHEGEPVEIFTTPNGETVMVNEEGEVVAVAFPSEPVFMGYMTVIGSDGTPTSTQIFQLHDGTEVVVEDGQLLGTLDEVEIPTVDADIFPESLTPPGWAEVDEFYLKPMGPESYDTYVIDAATGEPVDELDTGTPVLGSSDYTTYHPPGTDLAMVMENETGQVFDTYQIPEEPEWSFLGVIEVYEDGTVSIDLAVVEIDVDLIGPEKGISVGVDLFFIEVGAGVEWDTDGNWDFEAYVDVDLGTVEWGGDFEMSWEDGEFAAGVDGYVGMQLGSFEAFAEGGVDLVVGADGSVEVGLSAGAHASGSFMGNELELHLEGAVDIGPGGVEGRLGANGALESSIFGDFEAGASWDSETGFDSYAGAPGDARGQGGDGLDMGWTDDLEADGFDGEADGPDPSRGFGADGARVAGDGDRRPLRRDADGNGDDAAVGADAADLLAAGDRHGPRWRAEDGNAGDDVDGDDGDDVDGDGLAGGAGVGPLADRPAGARVRGAEDADDGDDVDGDGLAGGAGVGPLADRPAGARVRGAEDADVDAGPATRVEPSDDPGADDASPRGPSADVADQRVRDVFDDVVAPPAAGPEHAEERPLAESGPMTEAPDRSWAVFEPNGEAAVDPDREVAEPGAGGRLDATDDPITTAPGRAPTGDGVAIAAEPSVDADPMPTVADPAAPVFDPAPSSAPGDGAAPRTEPIAGPTPEPNVEPAQIVEAVPPPEPVVDIAPPEPAPAPPAIDPPDLDPPDLDPPDLDPLDATT